MNLVTRNGQEFGKEAQNFTMGRKPYPSAVFNFLVENCPPQDYPSVIDIGCGNGRATNQLKDYGFTHVTGYDSDFRMIQEAEKVNNNVHYIIGSVLELVDILNQGNKAEKIRDLVTSFTSLHFFNSQEEIESIRSVLKDNGRFFVLKENLAKEGFKSSCQNFVAKELGIQFERIGNGEKNVLTLEKLLVNML